MILYKSRSAKSVACSRLNVIGVSAFFFLPVLVAALTSADEFHSVTKTRWPSALNHLANSPNCVVFPDPSIPSTTNSLPGYSWGCVSVFSMDDSAHLDSKGLAGQPLERRRVTRRGPQLELGVARRPQLEEIVVAPVVELEAGNRLRVAAIETFREAQQRGERADNPARAARQRAEAVVLSFRRRLTMIPRDERNRLDLLGLEAPEIPILDQIVRVFVVALVTDVHPHVVKNRGIFEPFPLPVGEPVNGARLVEEGDREPGHLLRVLGPVVAPLRQFVHASPPDVRIAIRLRDFLAVPGDVVEHQPLAQRQIAQRQLVGSQAAQQFVEENRAGDSEVAAARLEPRHAQPLVEVQRDELLAHVVDLLGGDAAIAERCARCAAFGCEGDGAETEDGARRADDPVESGTIDLLEVFADLVVDVASELPLVAGLQRVGPDEALGEPDDAELEAASELDSRARSPRHLDAAAADVDDYGDVARDTHAIHRRRMYEARFLSTRDESRADARQAGDGLQELAAVLGLARCASRDRDDVIHPMRFGQTPEFRKDLKRRVHRFGCQGAAIEAAGAETDHFLLAVDDFEGVIGPDLHHDHVNRVGLDVDGDNSHNPRFNYNECAGLEPQNMPARRSQLLKRRLDRLTRPLPDLERGDVRALHRTRVASRRLRELVPMLQIDADR